jgi:MerR family transcriptional regulator, aldehyde-responsive regulator
MKKRAGLNGDLDEAVLGGGGFREYTIQETAEITGLSEHTLRYYERIGLITPVRRASGSRHRRYTAIDLARIEALACLRMVGMPIEDMRRYGELSFEDSKDAPELLRILKKQRKVLEDRKEHIEETIRYVDLKTKFLVAVATGDEKKIDAAMKRFMRNLERLSDA